LKQHKIWFDEQCSKLLNQRKEAKLQRFQHPDQANGDNLNSVKCKTSKNFRKREGISKSGN